MTVDSTGDPYYGNGGPKPYTLTVGEDKIELSSKNLGPADVALVAAWLQRPEVSAAVARPSLKGNFPCDRISKDGDGMAPWLPGKNFSSWISLCESFEQSTTLTEIDVSECYLGPEALTPLGKAIKAMAALNSVTIDFDEMFLADLKDVAPEGCQVLWKKR